MENQATLEQVQDRVHKMERLMEELGVPLSEVDAGLVIS